MGVICSARWYAGGDAASAASLPLRGALTPRAHSLYLPAFVFMNKQPHVAVVGATGAVGVEMIKTLEKRNFPVGKLTLLASARSVGKKLKFKGQDVTITELTEHSFKGIDIAD